MYDHRLIRLNDMTTLPTHQQVQLPQVKELFLRGSNCTDCDLSKTRKNIVWSRGTGTSRIMLVGEAPGAEEDFIGQPFVGKSGQLLTTTLLECGFDPNTFYICNTLKCRPPANRVPWSYELRACGKYLHAQIVDMNPALIVAVGKTAKTTLLNNYKIKVLKYVDETPQVIGLKIDGKLQDLDFGLPHIWVPMYSIWHPAYILRQYTKLPEYIEQINVIKELLNTTF